MSMEKKMSRELMQQVEQVIRMLEDLDAFVEIPPAPPAESEEDDFFIGSLVEVKADPKCFEKL